MTVREVGDQKVISFSGVSEAGVATQVFSGLLGKKSNQLHLKNRITYGDRHIHRDRKPYDMEN
jgi:hypothetical protein